VAPSPWGRVEETYGEDPYLVSRLGIAAVRGFQVTKTFGQAACAGDAEALCGTRTAGIGMNCAPANVSMRCCGRRSFTPSKKLCAKRGRDADGFVQRDRWCSSHANKWLLRDLLRKEWASRICGFGLLRHLGAGYRPDTHGHFVAKDKRNRARWQ